MLKHSVTFTALSMIAFLLHSGQMHSATFTMHFTLAACCHGCIINAFDGPSAFRCIHVHSRIVHYAAFDGPSAFRNIHVHSTKMHYAAFEGVDCITLHSGACEVCRIPFFKCFIFDIYVPLHTHMATDGTSWTLQTIVGDPEGFR